MSFLFLAFRSTMYLFQRVTHLKVSIPENSDTNNFQYIDISLTNVQSCYKVSNTLDTCIRILIFKLACFKTAIKLCIDLFYLYSKVVQNIAIQGANTNFKNLNVRMKP